MKKVYKYNITDMNDYFDLNLPKGAKILTVQVQRNSICIWALVDINNEQEKRRFRLAGTGHPIEESTDRLIYIGSFQMMQGTLVFHLFEIKW